MYPEMSGLRSLLAKDKNIKITFIQNNLLVSPLLSFTEFRKPYLNTRLEIPMSRLFLNPPYLNSSSFEKKGEEGSLLISTN
jgi:hypothetical protein